MECRLYSSSRIFARASESRRRVLGLDIAGAESLLVWALTHTSSCVQTFCFHLLASWETMDPRRCSPYHLHTCHNQKHESHTRQWLGIWIFDNSLLPSTRGFFAVPQPYSLSFPLNWGILPSDADCQKRSRIHKVWSGSESAFSNTGTNPFELVPHMILLAVSRALRRPKIIKICCENW